MSESDNSRQSAAFLPTILFQFCPSESLFASVAIVRGIVERRELEGLDVGNYDFVYATAVCANKNVNEDIIRFLLENFPVAASKTGEDGDTLLHHAVENPNVTLNIIKLLVDAAPDSVRSVDNDGSMPLHSLCVIEKDEPVASGAIPLHIACQHHVSSSVIQYLIGLDTTTRDAADREGNTSLHFACRGAKYETISMLLEKYDAISVSRRNSLNKLPIDLLWESDFVEDRESIEYTVSVFRLLKAYPETVTNNNIITTKQSADAGTSQVGKKRKFVL